MENQNMKSKDERLLLGVEAGNALSKVLKKKWGHIGGSLKWSAIISGAGFPLFFLGGIIRNSFGPAMLFLIATIVGLVSIAKTLKEAYLLEGAENYLKETYGDFPYVAKSCKSATRFLKLLSIIGTQIGSYLAVFLIPKRDPIEQINVRFDELYAEAVAAVLVTGWIAFLIIWICQLVMKRYAKNHDRMCENIGRSILVESAGNTEAAKRIRSEAEIPVTHGVTIGYVAAALSLVGCFMIIQPLLPEIELGTQIVDNSDSTETELETQTETENTESIVVDESEDDEITDEEWYNMADSNGYGFSISQECLDAYLAYAASDEGAQAYYNMEKGEGDFATYQYPTHFSIAGMGDGEPFLIFGYGENPDTDELMFCVYGSYAGTVHPTELWAKSWDNQSMVSRTSGELYVVSAEIKPKYTIFVEQQETYYSDEYESTGDAGGTTDYAYYSWQYEYREGDWFESSEYMDNKSESWCSSSVYDHSLTPVKWFAISDIESARAYYSQFIRGEYVPQDSADRDTYFKDANCALSLLPAFDEGEFSIEEFNGYTTYEFALLSSEKMSELRKIDLNSDLSFVGGTGTSTVHIDIFKNSDGTYRVISRDEYYSGSDDGKFRIYEADEWWAVTIYNSSGEDFIESIDELFE